MPTTKLPSGDGGVALRMASRGARLRRAKATTAATFRVLVLHINTQGEGQTMRGRARCGARLSPRALAALRRRPPATCPATVKHEVSHYSCNLYALCYLKPSQASACSRTPRIRRALRVGTNGRRRYGVIERTRNGRMASRAFVS